MSTDVRSFFHASTSTWTHIVTDPATRTAAIIDPVLDFDAASGRVWTESAENLVQYLHDSGSHVAWILETHAHADHLTAADWLKRRPAANGVAPTVAIGEGIVKVQRHFRDVFALGDEFPADGSQFDHLFRDGERFEIGELQARVVATPGHTSDSVSYLIGDAVFVGDSLFAPRLGTARCDFPGADAATLYRSIQRLYDLPDATRVFLCHDYPAADSQPLPETTIAAQKSDNIQVRSQIPEIDYVAMRTKRDATLAVPKLLYPSLQVNIRAGRLPPVDSRGHIFFKLPVHASDFFA